MSPHDTIVACATPVGYSSIGVVRLSGEQAVLLTKKIFLPIDHTQEFEVYRVYYGDIVEPESREVVDKVLTTFFYAPHSYTGEDVVEFSCHGNPLIIEQIIKILIRLGARIAQRGEFTRRALINGKIDLLQAEAVLDTVYATCDQARKLAILQYEGKLSEKIYELRSKIVDLLFLVEAEIDFPEEEDVHYDKIGFINKLNDIINETEEYLKNSNIGVKIRDGYKTLIIGRTNVGKSTLFNRLVGHDRAIVHERPGTTRDFIEEGVQIGDLYLRLYDTAGIFSQAEGPDEIAQQRTTALIEQADLILLMFDGSEPMNEEDVYLYDLTKQRRKLLVVNKIDLNIKLNEDKILSDSIKISAKTGKNVRLLKENIRKFLFPEYERKDIILTRQRHIQALKKAKEYLNNARNAGTLETVAYELHCALDEIGELTGKVIRKEILDRIFEEFCVGK